MSPNSSEKTPQSTKHESALPLFDEASYLSIHYLNDLLFCERRAALHVNEQIWKHNQFTTEGLLAHKRVDMPKNMRRGVRRNVTGMWLVSHRLGLIGIAKAQLFPAFAELS